MALAESWHVRSRSRECAATQRRFDDEEPIVTALFPDPETSGYLRRDYCIEAWEQRGTHDESAFSFWRSTFRVPESETKEDPMKKLSPEELLQRLIEEDEEHTENTRYILAVMLERQKLLRETDSQKMPEGILRVYEHRKSGEVFLVRDPDIPLEAVEKVQQEVFVLLENNGRIPEPEPEAPASEEDPSQAPEANAGELDDGTESETTDSSDEPESDPGDEESTAEESSQEETPNQG